MNTVVAIDAHKGQNVYRVIEGFLNRLGIKSENTARNYRIHLDKFFSVTKNKKLSQLDEQDIQIKRSDINKFQYILHEEGYKGRSINTKVAAVRSLYNEFLAEGYDVNINVFNVPRLPETDSKGYGVLEWEEVEKMIEVVRNTRKGLIKALLIKTAAVTALRQRALLSLKWNDIKIIDGVPVICVVDKGKIEHEVAISDELYNELKTLRGGDDERLFAITPKSINKMMEYACKAVGIDKEGRNITFHSLKKASIKEANLVSGGDIKVLQAHAKHKDPRTTLKHYMALNKDLQNDVSRQIGKKVEMKSFEEMSKEELLALISSSDRSTQLKLMDKIKQGG